MSRGSSVSIGVYYTFTCMVITCHMSLVFSANYIGKRHHPLEGSLPTSHLHSLSPQTSQYVVISVLGSTRYEAIHCLALFNQRSSIAHPHPQPRVDIDQFLAFHYFTFARNLAISIWDGESSKRQHRLRTSHKMERNQTGLPSPSLHVA